MLYGTIEWRFVDFVGFIAYVDNRKITITQFESGWTATIQGGKMYHKYVLSGFIIKEHAFEGVERFVEWLNEKQY